MSFEGQNPSKKWFNFIPQSADPTSPNEGDIYFSDGTPRDAGLWVYQAAAWTQVSVGATLSVLPNLTLTPQATDPGTPAEGMLFMSNGTPRAEGLWLYVNGNWSQTTGRKYQEFFHKSIFDVRTASTANVTLVSQVENGDSFGGVTLVTGDLVLLKNQTTTTENGVYTVNISGAPTRSTSYDDATELTYAQIWVSSGTNANTRWFQINSLSTLSDAQSWSTTAPTYSFTVPEAVYEIDIDGNGGGGGGGAGADGVDGSNKSGSGGGGGAGATPQAIRKVPVTPGETLTITIGAPGLKGNHTGLIAGTDGGSSQIINFANGLKVYFAGAVKGSNGNVTSSPPTGNIGGVGGAAFSGQSYIGISVGSGGNGGNTAAGTSQTGASSPQYNAHTASLSTGGIGGAALGGGFGGSGGGGGGPGRGVGANGGRGADNGSNNAAAGSSASNHGAGGGGGGGGSEAGSLPGGSGGHGGSGYIKISW